MEDARAFGLVATEADGRVLAFREKPEDLIPGDINAGTYLLDPKVLRDRTPGEASSIERDIFPAVIEAGHPVFGFLAEAYWLDLGTPEKYLQAHFDMLEGKVHDVSYPAPWIADGAEVDLRAHLGRWVAVGEGTSIGPRHRSTIRCCTPTSRSRPALASSVRSSRRPPRWGRAPP